MGASRLRRSLIGGVIVGSTLSISGCAGPSRPVLTDEQLRVRSEADAAESEATFHRAVDKILNRIEREQARGASIDILAISGGGDKGAFCAGFLVGWGDAPGDWERPEFDAVTGVSTGALLAPFAYLGTDEALEEVESFYRNPKSDWVRSRGMFFFLPSNPSFASLPGLERDIRAALDSDFIEQLAQESRKGKVILVSATDLDLGRQKFWDLGVEAENAATPEDRHRLQSMLLASAAIPAVFPPVQIGDSLYADGAATANVLLRLERRNPNSLLMRWRSEHPGTPLPPVRYWVIINNQLEHRALTVQMRWPAVVGPSFSTSIRSATIAEVRLLAAEADYVNAVYGTDIEVRVVAIPNHWRPPVEGDFQEKTMRALTDLGRDMGAVPGSWMVWTTPPDRDE